MMLKAVAGWVLGVGKGPPSPPSEEHWLRGQQRVAVGGFLHHAGTLGQQDVGNGRPRQRRPLAPAGDRVEGPTTKRSAESVRDLQQSQPSGCREFWGQVKAEPLCSQVTVSSWGPSASRATAAESHLPLLARSGRQIWGTHWGEEGKAGPRSFMRFESAHGRAERLASDPL